jgi:hypothetical protein
VVLSGYSGLLKLVAMMIAEIFLKVALDTNKPTTEEVNTNMYLEMLLMDKYLTNN